MSEIVTPDYSEDLKGRILSYYRKMYGAVGLTDFEERSISRLKEEEADLRRCHRLERALSLRMGDYEHHLIVGTGTGGLVVALKQMGVKDVFGCEPNAEALAICAEKAGLASVNPDNMKNAVAEQLPFGDSSMDMIHCYTVLEHVQQVEQAIREMFRVLKPGGIIYIQTPDYRNFFEGHYKMVLPLFLGKTVSKWSLRLSGRPTVFLESIQFIDEKSINKILRKNVDLYFRLYERMPTAWERRGQGLRGRLGNWLRRFFYLSLSFPIHQEIIIKKNPVMVDEKS